MLSNKIFLNDIADEYGSVAWRVKNNTSYKTKKILPEKVSASIRLTDCSRSIDLDFWYGNEKQFKERVDKISTLISELEVFRTHLSNSFIKKTKKDKKKKKTKVKALKDVLDDIK